MEEREGKASKLRKLEHFRRQLPYLSCKALQDVITLVKESGCPDLHSRKNIKEAVCKWLLMIFKAMAQLYKMLR